MGPVRTGDLGLGLGLGLDNSLVEHRRNHPSSVSSVALSSNLAPPIARTV